MRIKHIIFSWNLGIVISLYLLANVAKPKTKFIFLNLLEFIIKEKTFAKKLILRLSLLGFSLHLAIL